MTAADLTLKLRGRVNDTLASNFVRSEIPKGELDSSNKRFYLANLFLVTTASPTDYSPNFYIDGTLVTKSLYAITSAQGLIAWIGTAPSGTKAEVDYYYYKASDDMMSQFLDGATQLTEKDVTDPTDVPDGMAAILVEYAAYYFYDAMAARFADKFQASAGSQSSNPDPITKNYKELSAKALASADKMPGIEHAAQDEGWGMLVLVFLLIAPPLAAIAVPSRVTARLS